MTLEDLVALRTQQRAAILDANAVIHIAMLRVHAFCSRGRNHAAILNAIPIVEMAVRRCSTFLLVHEVTALNASSNMNIIIRTPIVDVTMRS
jgi:hypothetical protein